MPETVMRSSSTAAGRIAGVGAAAGGAAHHRRPRAGADTTPTVAAAVLDEADQRRPHRHAAGEVLGAVDRVEHPARGRPASSPPRSSPSTASSGRWSAITDRRRVLARGVGVGDGGAVGLALDAQVGGPEARQRHRVGGVGEGQGEGEVVGMSGSSVGRAHGGRSCQQTPTTGLLWRRDHGAARRGRRGDRRTPVPGAAARGLRGRRRRRRSGRARSRAARRGRTCWCSTSACPAWTASRSAGACALDQPDLPVLMLTARTDEVDFVVGLDAGADDYVGQALPAGRAAGPGAGAAAAPGPGGAGRGRGAARAVGAPGPVDGVEVGLANKEFELLRVLHGCTPGRWSRARRSCARCGTTRR